MESAAVNLSHSYPFGFLLLCQQYLVQENIELPMASLHNFTRLIGESSDSSESGIINLEAPGYSILVLQGRK